MNGHRALVTISVRAASEADENSIRVWIDTGFNGDLVLPRHKIESLAL